MPLIQKGWKPSLKPLNMKIVRNLALVFVIFFISFISVTALLDWVCWTSGYYNEGIHESEELFK